MTGRDLVAVDTSVAVPLLSETHRDHDAVLAWSRGRQVALTGHSLAECYSVLTRLAGDMRSTPGDAAARLARGFAAPRVLSPEATRRVPATLAAAGVAGGAVYDALVALAAREHDVVLATRDRRALPTYRALGARVEVVG